MITGNHLQSNVRCIYFLSFPNDKKYIGQTNHFNKRLNSYKNDSINNSKKTNLKVRNAINKYGWDNVNKDIVLICENESADYYEQKLIEKFKTTDGNYGYNIEAGGFKNKITSKETAEKISKALTGRKLSPTHRENVAKATRKKVRHKKWRDNISKANKGKVRSEEYKKRMSRIKLKQYQNNEIILSQEAIDKMSNASRKRWASPKHRSRISKLAKLRWQNPAYKDRMRNKLLGHPVSEETKDKIAFKNSREYKIVNPNGEIITIRNLTKFCRENSLNTPEMCKIASGKRKSAHRGYECELMGVSND